MGTRLARAVRAARGRLGGNPCANGHSRFQRIVNRRDGTRVQVCDRCRKPVGKPLPAERREFRRVA